MKPKYRRLFYLLLALVSVSAGVLLMLSALKDNVVFFYSPSEMLVKNPGPEQRLRVGGLVVEGSVKQSGRQLAFTVTDTATTLPIIFEGIPPGLFREGQGVVAEGYFRDGKFQAATLLAKHDENYMPPEVAEAVKKSGHWKEKMRTQGFKP